MNCCEKCFLDAEIIDIIKNKKVKGTCDFCGSSNVYVYDLNRDSTLSDMLGELIDIYTPASNLPTSFPKKEMDLLKNILFKNWSIFNLPAETIYSLITTICHEKYVRQPELFDLPIGILESQDKEFLKAALIIKEHKWDDFVDDIKHVNRFHTNHINTPVLLQFIKCASKIYKPGKTLYRARISKDHEGFAKKDMGAPPVELSTEGRVSPAGIQTLYLANSVKTTIHETRAGVFDYVSVGSFRLQKEAELIDFANLDKISPFIANNTGGISYTQYALNVDHLRKISQDVAKPLRRQDSTLDYLPTQYICDFIKSKGYAGVEYKSTVLEGGINIAIFDGSIFRCTNTTVYGIKSIDYKHEPISGFMS